MLTGIVEQGAGIVPALQLGADALQPVFSHGGQVGRGDAGGRPFGLGKRAVAEHVLVEGGGFLTGGVAQRIERAGLERHDLAVAGEGGHALPSPLAGRVRRAARRQAACPITPASSRRSDRTAAATLMRAGRRWPKNFDLEQACAFVLGKCCRHVALRHRFLHVMRIAARGHPADDAPFAVDDAAHGGRACGRRRAAHFLAVRVEARRAVAMRLFDRAIILAVRPWPRSARRP